MCLKNKEEENDFLRKLKNNDSESWNTFYHGTPKRIAYGIMHKMGVQDTDRHDIYQDTIMAFNRNIKGENFKVEVDLCSYFYGIVRYCCLKFFRARKHYEPLEGNDEGEDLSSSPFEYPEDNPKTVKIKEALNELPSLSREVFLLIKAEGLSYEELIEWKHPQLMYPDDAQEIAKKTRNYTARVSGVLKVLKEKLGIISAEEVAKKKEEKRSYDKVRREDKKA